MVMELRRVDDSTLKSLIADPKEAAWFISGIEPSGPRRGLFSRLFGKEEEEKKEPREWQFPPCEEVLDVDKSWHALHFLLTGTGGESDSPRAFLLHGGTSVATGDFPILFHTADEVEKIYDSISSESFESYINRYDVEKMKEEDIYKFDELESSDEDMREYATDYLKSLIEFIELTTKNKQGLAISMG